MTKHHGLFAVVKEVTLVLTCLRPGVQIWRLRRGAEHDPGAPVDPKMAMMMGKVGERVFESIPGSILTAITLLNHANARSPSTLASAIVACLATAFVATTIAYNFDTDASKRNTYPACYGYKPSRKRVLTGTSPTLLRVQALSQASTHVPRLQPSLLRIQALSQASTPRRSAPARFIGRYMGYTPASKIRCFCVLFVVHAAQVLKRCACYRWYVVWRDPCHVSTHRS
jgi:hypothetical protein